MEVETDRKDSTNTKDEEAQAQVDIWKYILGFTEIAAVKCAIELGIPDLLQSDDGRPMPLSELSSALRCSSSALFRVMRFLIHRGIFKEKSTATATGYVHTPLSRLLTSHGDNSMAPLVLLESSPVMLAAWHGLSARVLENGAPSFVAFHGCDLWSYAAANPLHSKLINDAMACDARVAVSAIVGGCPEVFHGVECLVDVGGGDGTTLRNLIRAFPWIRRGINFDLPNVVSSVAPPADSCDGVEYVGGDMFHSIPKADAAFFMWVLHDWGDDECIQILKNCRDVIPKEKGKVIIVEAVIEGGGGNKLKDVGLMLDMVMMAHTNTGKERTLKEWAYVLTAAGFKQHTVKHIHAVQSVIVAYP